MSDEIKQIKIGIVSDNFLPEIGGGQIHIENLAKFLKKEGHDVQIFTNTPGEEIIDGIQIQRNKDFGFKPFRLFRDIKNLYSFIKSCDLIHAHYSFYLAFLSGFLAKILRKPLVITVQGLGTLDSSIINFRRRVFRYFSLKFADRVISTSQEMAEVAWRFTDKEKVFHISNGVDTEFFKSKHLPKKDSKIRVLSVRRLNPKNGVQYLIEAIPYIVKEVKDTEFLITGKAKLENYLRKRVKELKIEDFVKFIGEIPNEKTVDYYNFADIITFPSSAESTSIACLEAMACQKAIVASALSAFKEMLGENQRGILVKLFDRELSDYKAPLTLPEEKIRALAEAIISLAKDLALRERLGREARQYVIKNYDWKVIIKRTQEVYSEIVK